MYLPATLRKTFMFARIRGMRPWASLDSSPPHTCSASSCLKPQLCLSKGWLGVPRPFLLTPKNTDPSPSGKEKPLVPSLEWKEKHSHSLGAFHVNQLMVERTWDSGRKRDSKNAAIACSSDHPTQETISVPHHTLFWFLQSTGVP